VAATGERVMQDLVLEIVHQVKEETNSDRLALSGGLFQNVALNRRIAEADLFKQIHVPMAPSDAGLSLGQLLFEVHKQREHAPKTTRKMPAYLGPSFSEKEIESLLGEMRLIHERSESIVDWAVERLLAGKVVGWFQGRGEYGPRALGNRSILADPRITSIKARVNQLLKKRDWFMPYAPAVLEEFGSEWAKHFFVSPYMQFVFEFPEDRHVQVSSAVHVDGTSRIQSVNEKDNPLFYALIRRFYEHTGIPMVLNTSFNRHGIATIGSPRQALDHFLEGCVDCLAIGPFGLDIEENRLLTPPSLKVELSEKILLAQHCLNHLRQLVEQGSIHLPWSDLVTQLNSEFGLNLSLDQKNLYLKTKDDDYPLSDAGLQRLMNDLPSIVESVV